MLNDKQSGGVRAFVLENDNDALRVMETALSNAGVAVRSSGSFQEFKAQYGDKVDLIVFDLVMPDSDGIEVLRFLAERHCTAVLVLASAVDDRMMRAAARLAQAHDLTIGGMLKKPLELESMTALVSTLDLNASRDVESTQVLVSHRAMQKKIEQRSLDVIYQPKIRLSTNEIDGVEALTRWPDVSGPQVSTPSLIYVAEKADLIDLLTIQVLERGLNDLIRWSNSGIDVKLSINISPRSLNNDQFVNKILSVTEEFPIPASRIVFEVTEKAFSTDLILPLENLSRLGLKGFGISIDDFGTGHSSFERMNLVPFNELKLDKSFVLSIRDDPQSYEIVRAALELGKRLGVDVVAEGVESADIWRELKLLGCDLAQGYFVTSGVNGEAYPEWAMGWQQRITEDANILAGT